ncbi:hypothetical protein BG015_003110 [Linnemannia schmuckeri]|uniref:Uncharacterized protein n=1 Tax=Linnemannia schmuckeri TaxID=64567 RepID=A0A9P5S4Y3_9FUNG|nr:hypothetical protein BG015_003110 [Linnemannia schmuckeri]
MAILWLRESSPKDGTGRASLFNPRSQSLQQEHQEEVLLLQVKKHHVSMKQGEAGRVTEPVVSRAGKVTIGQWQGGRRSTKDISGNSNSGKDQGSGRQQRQTEKREQDQEGHHPYRALKTTPRATTTTTVNSQSTAKRATERIKSRISSFAAAAAFSIPKARKVIKGNKSNKSRKLTSKAKNPNEVRNQQGGFKSTQERKQAQLVPVLDEHGNTIEDHFISPRDSDGDGVPDHFVLLRPFADNAKDMMDLGLFDDDVVVPATVAAPPPSLPQPVVPVTAPPSAAPAAAPEPTVVSPAVRVEAAATTNPSASAPVILVQLQQLAMLH